MPTPPPPKPTPTNAGRWQNVLVFSTAPPTAHVVLRGLTGGSFRWRVFGAGIPFYLEGVSSSAGAGVQSVDVWIGWTGGFCSVDVLTTSGAGVQAWFCAWPGRPPGMPSPP
jgi:hypothetical protein